MKTTLIIAAAMAALVSAAPAVAQEYTKGTVKEVKADQEKVTVIHEELKNLDMPAMTMVFTVADPAMLDGMAEGDAIEFVADRVRGKLTITEVK
jgi:Cu/Ag efflux protein CusF